MPGKALLLDRDGVVNIDHGYVGSRDRFTFLEGIFDLTRHAVDRGYRVVVVTNQSGIARGLYTEESFHALSAWMEQEFAAKGVALAGVFHCPHHPDAVIPAYRRESFWRKPAPGMILEAARRLDLDLPRSVFLGDQETDMRAARAAGVGLRALCGDGPATGDPDIVLRHPVELIPYLR
jgi:D-glycero-D-manno-heptose 1,7-bisphosphate phosphatase